MDKNSSDNNGKIPTRRSFYAFLALILGAVAIVLSTVFSEFETLQKAASIMSVVAQFIAYILISVNGYQWVRRKSVAWKFVYVILVTILVGSLGLQILGIVKGSIF